MAGGYDWLKFKPVILAYFLAGDDSKPHVIREMIERVSPAPYLELFNPQAVPGWSVWHPKTGCTLDHEQASVPLQPSVATDYPRVEPEAENADAKRVGRTRKTPPHAAATDTLVPPSSSDFHLPAEMSFAKEMIVGGVAYVFRHCDLGLLGRIVVQDLTGRQCLVSRCLMSQLANQRSQNKRHRGALGQMT